MLYDCVAHLTAAVLVTVLVLAVPVGFPPVGHQHGRQQRRVGVLHLNKPGRVRNLFAVELDVHSVSAGVVGDKVGLEMHVVWVFSMNGVDSLIGGMVGWLALKLVGWLSLLELWRILQ